MFRSIGIGNYRLSWRWDGENQNYKLDISLRLGSRGVVFLACRQLKTGPFARSNRNRKRFSINWMRYKFA
jgi:hypothetical protein